MKIIKGNKKLELSREEFLEKANNYERVEIDLGTGDGRFVYKNAQKNPGTLFIGIDPSEKQLLEFSKKAVRQKVENVIFATGSIEIFPRELSNMTDKIYINLPWGSLLKEALLPSTQALATLNETLKQVGELNLLLGYDPEFEPSETKRLSLPEINEELLTNTTIPAYKNAGFENTNTTQINKEDLSEIETTWSKKLAHGNPRRIFRLSFTKN